MTSQHSAAFSACLADGLIAMVPWRNSNLMRLAKFASSQSWVHHSSGRGEVLHRFFVDWNGRVGCIEWVGVSKWECGERGDCI